MNEAIRRLELGEFVDRDTMRFVREYPHPPERVWAALIDPGQLSEWLMTCTMLEPRVGGKYAFRAPGGSEMFGGRLSEFEALRVINFSGVWRFALSATEGGCRLSLEMKRSPEGWNPSWLAGNQMRFEILRSLLDGDVATVERIKQSEGWSCFFAAYEFHIQRNITGGAPVIYRIHFAEKNAALAADAKPILERVVKILQDSPGLPCAIVGYCDEDCSEDEAMKLSQERASSASRYLEQAGIASERIRTVGSGNYHRIVPPDTQAARAYNRRVDLRPIY
ncbi:MAG TPA: OmpA family protein [Candidatus Binataceae bacterium]|nr:OmpA family protein [Candidatus Binataceae bacterium]